jgi:hypothetical protein
MRITSDLRWERLALRSVISGLRHEEAGGFTAFDKLRQCAGMRVLWPTARSLRVAASLPSSLSSPPNAPSSASTRQPSAPLTCLGASAYRPWHSPWCLHGGQEIRGRSLPAQRSAKPPSRRLPAAHTLLDRISPLSLLCTSPIAASDDRALYQGRWNENGACMVRRRCRRRSSSGKAFGSCEDVHAESVGRRSTAMSAMRSRASGVRCLPR